MNKKKIIIIASVVLLAIILGVLGFLLFGGKKTDDKPNSDVIVSSIFLEINPSIRIDLDKDEKIINVVALNDDAKDIIPNEFKGKEIPETIDNITEKLVEKGYAKEEVIMLVNTTGKIKCENVKEILDASLSKKEIKSNIIEPEITESSKELAKELNISETKAAYIESITKENPEIKAEDIKDKSVSEITEIKEQSKEFTVNFDMDGTGDSAKVKNGEKVTKPANPTKNGYTFVEWQLDGVKFDFNTPITGDITLKAVWKQNQNANNNSNNSNNNSNSGGIGIGQLSHDDMIELGLLEGEKAEKIIFEKLGITDVGIYGFSMAPFTDSRCSYNMMAKTIVTQYIEKEDTIYQYSADYCQMPDYKFYNIKKTVVASASQGTLMRKEVAIQKFIDEVNKTYPEGHNFHLREDDITWKKASINIGRSIINDDVTYNISYTIDVRRTSDNSGYLGTVDRYGNVTILLPK